ncbi:Ig domain protein group 2 domain protein (plasmid) [Gemmatirosa kalamazoonensis]|uniref:Intimin n=1 Tax=Gemmatirosa kalamazoonensis TaxID=861299 RepID=W0RSA4_9BACT|nr:Ig-like domain-containing protein [Gemmatirosa kalamazoonensis]AHG93864.1 Ig domain protein group 2 domain protein [Gemmatirosa kalamazoonensis]
MPLARLVRRRLLAAPAVLACLTFAACGGGDTLRVIQHVKSVEINPSTDTVDVGTTRTLQARVVPDNPDAEAPPNLSSITWTSSDTSRLTISAAGSAVTVSGKAAGSVTLTARSVADPNVAATAQIVVTPRPAITLAVVPAAVSPVGGQTGADVTLTRVGRVTSPVDVTVEDLPNGVTPTVTPATLSGGVTTAHVTLAVAGAATPGDFPLTVRGKTQGVSDATAPLMLRVPGFSLALPTSTISVSRGLSGGSTARVAGVGGFAIPVALSLDPAPPGISATLSRSTGAAGDTVRISARVDSTMGAGTYPLTLRGKANGFADQIARLTIAVPPPVAARLVVTAGDNQVAAGNTPTPIQPAVRVVDANNFPVPNVTVDFRVTGGAGSVTTRTDISDANGIAQTTWTLGPSGPNTLVASVPSVPAVPAVTFRATASTGLTSIVLGDAFSCGINSSRQVVCWGDNTYGQLGDGTRTSRGVPRTAGTSAQFTQLVAGASHVCGLTTNASNQVYCWGRNVGGALGLGDTQDRLLPTPIQGTTLAKLSALAAGTDFTCGLTVATGQAYCWGVNTDGQLGDGTTTNRTRPVTVSGGATFSAIAAGGAHTCGTTTAGATLCWGRNADGQLGDSTTAAQGRPTLVKGGQSFVSLSLGLAHSCAVTNAGQAYCWGNNASGQLGDGTTTSRLTPALVATNQLLSRIGTHSGHTCAVTSTSGALCWGANADGQLGDGGTAPHATPAAVTGGLLFTTVDVGASHSCGIAGGIGYCWGKNASGQLGDNSTTSRVQPMPIALGVLGNVRVPDR